MADRDEDTGEYRETYPDPVFLDALREHGAASTSEVAEVVGCGVTTAFDRLAALEDEKRVESRMIGSSRLWTAVVE